ncbi:MAG: DUF3375 domain-containing protein [Planctomycetota bacterium]
MHIESLQKFFASSPAVRLLRSPHAFWIMDFLNQQFKLAGKITRPHSELAVELDAYLDQLSKDAFVGDAKFDSRDKADTYLASWCSGSIGWLKRFIDEDATEPHYQLTAEFEKALAFVEKSSRDIGFIGTESRLRSILEILGNIVSGVQEDPTIRLRQLEAQKAEIDREIALLRSSVKPTAMSKTQVRERFSLACQQLHQLKSEFRAVEDRFKEITRGVQQRILSSGDSRGDILQFALDSEDMLKHGDQGQSFFEFLKLLHSPESQDRIAELVEQLNAIESLAGEHEELLSLRSMVPTLIAEAEKILRTTQHLSVTLRRLLDSRSTRHHQQLSQVLRDILSSAASLAENPPDHLGLEVEVELEIQSPMDRPFWVGTEPFEEVQLAPVENKEEDQRQALEQLVALERLDWQSMRQNVDRLTEDSGAALAQLLERYPLAAGAVEVLGYLQIAYDDGHQIDPSIQVELPTKLTGELGRGLQIPNVVFLPKSQRKKSKTLYERSLAEKVL